MKQLYVESRNRTSYHLNRIKRYLQRYTLFEIVATTVSILLILWLAASYVDVISNNMGSCTYATWNLITILF